MTYILRKYNILFSLLLASLAGMLAGCSDDFFYSSEDIPDIDVDITGEVVFRPLTPVEVTTRSEAPEGGRYNGIRSLLLFFFDEEGKIVEKYSGDVTFTKAPNESSTHQRVKFTKRVHAGRYYIFAVANIPAAIKDKLIKEAKTIKALREFPLNWDGNIDNDLEMFGVFKENSSGSELIPDNEDFEENKLITVNRSMSLLSWVRRATSKVTIDFDGKNLKDGVTVYIRKAELKHVSSGAYLGAPSHAVGLQEEGADPAKDFICISSDYTLTYGRGESFGEWPTVTRTKTFSPGNVWSGSKAETFHSDEAPALPCYENLQGVREGTPKLQDHDNDGKLDNFHEDGSMIIKDDVKCGTYLEVEGYYVADRPEYKSKGRIVYRFMLGKNETNDFNLIRNHHYKITMGFKGYGNDIDWHVDYGENYLEATYPKDVNYQGKFFVPSTDYSETMANAGHGFEDKNVITVSSFRADGSGNHWIEPEISYSYSIYNVATRQWEDDAKANAGNGWLTTIPGSVVDNTYADYTFVASPADAETKTMDKMFPAGSASEDSANPYNLSNSEGKKDKVDNTANCYMVGKKGWYSFPLVYGNGFTGGADRASEFATDNTVNHLGNKIDKAYIIDNKDINLSNVKAVLIWQDAQKLIEPTTIQYDKTLYNDKGGIKFYIPGIKEGNAVIALIDNRSNVQGDDWIQGGNTKAIWSWHIWATRFGTGDFESDIHLINHDGEGYDVMPVNLGWCAGGNIRYYKRRKCVITFTVGDEKLTRTIEQYPHFLLPRGDHPYYQWGRKDPFVGTKKAFANKPRWNHNNDCFDDEVGNVAKNPPRLYEELKLYNDKEKRRNTEECLKILVQNPDKFHNGPREPKKPNEANSNPPYASGFNSTNRAPSDLWSKEGKKTLYDPCPVGYQVSDKNVFTGFTLTGGTVGTPFSWLDVIEDNMPSEFYGGKEKINSQVLEFYTDRKRLQSISFPLTGYRDYDSYAQVVNYPYGSYNGEGFIWFNEQSNLINSFHFKFFRGDIISGGTWQNRGASSIEPINTFYNTDAFGVRPMRTK